jgi:putative intracellular protease/amidase
MTFFGGGQWTPLFGSGASLAAALLLQAIKVTRFNVAQPQATNYLDVVLRKQIMFETLHATMRFEVNVVDPLSITCGLWVIVTAQNSSDAAASKGAVY